jgi:hypothetical protein
MAQGSVDISPVQGVHDLADERDVLLGHGCKALHVGASG